MTRTPEMRAEASLAQRASQGWECQTPSCPVSIHMLFQSTIFWNYQRKEGRERLGWEDGMGECVWMCT